jgi:hypothetical protein
MHQKADDDRFLSYAALRLIVIALGFLGVSLAAIALTWFYS